MAWPGAEDEDDDDALHLHPHDDDDHDDDGAAVDVSDLASIFAAADGQDLSYFFSINPAATADAASDVRDLSKIFGAAAADGQNLSDLFGAGADDAAAAVTGLSDIFGDSTASGWDLSNIFADDVTAAAAAIADVHGLSSIFDSFSDAPDVDLMVGTSAIGVGSRVRVVGLVESSEQFTNFQRQPLSAEAYIAYNCRQGVALHPKDKGDLKLWLVRLDGYNGHEEIKEVFEQSNLQLAASATRCPPISNPTSSEMSEDYTLSSEDMEAVHANAVYSEARDDADHAMQTAIEHSSEHQHFLDARGDIEKNLEVAKAQVVLAQEASDAVEEALAKADAKALPGFLDAHATAESVLEKSEALQAANSGALPLPVAEASDAEPLSASNSEPTSMGLDAVMDSQGVADHTVQVQSTGTAYTIGEKFHIGEGVEGWESPATLKVTSVGDDGALANLDIIDGGVFTGDGSAAGDYVLSEPLPTGIVEADTSELQMQARAGGEHSAPSSANSESQTMLRVGGAAGLLVLVVGVLLAKRRAIAKSRAASAAQVHTHPNLLPPSSIFTSHFHLTFLPLLHQQQGTAFSDADGLSEPLICSSATPCPADLEAGAAFCFLSLRYAEGGSSCFHPPCRLLSLRAPLHKQMGGRGQQWTWALMRSAQAVVLLRPLPRAEAERGTGWGLEGLITCLFFVPIGPSRGHRPGGRVQL
jgi:hypothetical protein